jgi:hypothetical protein
MVLLSYTTLRDFVRYLLNDAVSSSDCTAKNDRMINKIQSCGLKRPWPIWRHYSGTKNPQSRYLVSDKRSVHGNEAGVLTTPRQLGSVLAGYRAMAQRSPYRKLISSTGRDSQRHAPAASSPVKYPSTQWIGVWICPRTCFDSEENRFSIVVHLLTMLSILTQSNLQNS